MTSEEEKIMKDSFSHLEEFLENLYHYGLTLKDSLQNHQNNPENLEKVIHTIVKLEPDLLKI